MCQMTSRPEMVTLYVTNYRVKFVQLIIGLMEFVRVLVAPKTMVSMRSILSRSWSVLY